MAQCYVSNSLQAKRWLCEKGSQIICPREASDEAMLMPSVDHHKGTSSILSLGCVHVFLFSSHKSANIPSRNLTVRYYAIEHVVISHSLCQRVPAGSRG